MNRCFLCDYDKNECDECIFPFSQNECKEIYFANRSEICDETEVSE